MSRTERNTLFNTLASMEHTFAKMAITQRDQAEVLMTNIALKTKEIASSNRLQACAAAALPIAGTACSMTSIVQTVNAPKDPNAGKMLGSFGDGINRAQTAVQPFFQASSVQLETDKMFLQTAFQQEMQEYQSTKSDGKLVDQKRTELSQVISRETSNG